MVLSLDRHDDKVDIRVGCDASTWYALTACPTCFPCFSAEAVAEASEVVETATSLYLLCRDGWRSEGPRTVAAQPWAESPTNPTLMGEDMAIGAGSKFIILIYTSLNHI